jgi:CSLREA domain-containing protein
VVAEGARRRGADRGRRAPLAALADAATITVETNDDVSAADCTLRDAINAANDNAVSGACVAGDPSPTVDRIDFGLPGASTITLGSTLPAIAGEVSVDGPGASQLEISGNAAVQVLIVSSGGPRSRSPT